jgi:hypothetical protein
MHLDLGRVGGRGCTCKTSKLQKSEKEKGWGMVVHICNPRFLKSRRQRSGGLWFEASLGKKGKKLVRPPSKHIS